MKKSIMKKVLCLSIIATMAISMTGCSTEAEKVTSKTYELECCGSATIYSNGRLSVSGCKHFKCSSSKGRWCETTKNFYEFSVIDSNEKASGQLSGDTMYISVKNR